MRSPEDPEHEEPHDDSRLDRKPTQPESLASLTQRESMRGLKSILNNRLLSEIPSELDKTAFRERAIAIIRDVVADLRYNLSSQEQSDLAKLIISDILGFGVLDALLTDNAIREVIIADLAHVYAKREDTLVQTAVTFEDEDHLTRVLDKMTAPLGYFIQRDKLPTVFQSQWERGTIMTICPTDTRAMVVIITVAQS